MQCSTQEASLAEEFETCDTNKQGAQRVINGCQRSRGNNLLAMLLGHGLMTIADFVLDASHACQDT